MSSETGTSTWVEVDLAGLRENVRAVLSLLPSETTLCAVVKADGYGHGAVEVARTALQAGASRLAVTTVAEAVELREAGVQGPILLLSPHLPNENELIIHHRLTPTITCLPAAEDLAKTARAAGVTVPCHVEVDTGMGRSGVAVEQAVSLLSDLRALEGIRLEGLWQHFATAFNGRDPLTLEQLRRFEELLAASRRAGVGPPIAHAANSAAVLAVPEACFDMVRVGTLLYGQYPSSRVPRRLNLRDTWRFKTRIVEVRPVRRGQTVGYGAQWRAPRDSRIALLRVGLADGFGVEPLQAVQREARTAAGARRAIGRMLGRWQPRAPTVRGVAAPVVGRISMTQCNLDVTDIPNVCVGDEVLLPARRATTSARIPRVYLGGPEAQEVEA